MKHLNDKNIKEVEEKLKVTLPDDVKNQYSISNGLLGPTECHLLYKFKSNDMYDIEVINNSIKKEEWFPSSMKEHIFLGDDGCGNLIGFNRSTTKVVLWNPGDGEWVQEIRNTVTEMWNYIIELYENEA